MGDKIKEIENSIEYQQKHVALLSSKLNDQLEALERWKKSGFISEICADALHSWYETEIDSYLPDKITAYRRCTTCGIRGQRVYIFSDEVYTDRWGDFREEGASISDVEWNEAAMKEFEEE